MCGATVSTASGQSKVLTKRRNANARFLKDEVGWKIKKAVGGENDTCAGKVEGLKYRVGQNFEFRSSWNSKVE